MLATAGSSPESEDYVDDDYDDNGDDVMGGVKMIMLDKYGGDEHSSLTITRS